jgi:hypothetical protein
MPKILIASCPPVGHISPLLNVSRGLVARGDSVTVLSSARHADKIRAAGGEPRPLPLGADYDGSAFAADLPGRAETSGIARINFDVANIFVRPLPHQFNALRELLADNDYDAIITDAFFLGTLPLLLDGTVARPPILSYTTTPLFLTSRDTAPGGPGITPMPGAVGRLRNVCSPRSSRGSCCGLRTTRPTGCSPHSDSRRCRCSSWTAGCSPTG